MREVIKVKVKYIKWEKKVIDWWIKLSVDFWEY